MALSKSHFDRLRKIMSKLLESDFENRESILMFQNNAILRECRDIWNDWVDLDLEVNSVKEDRNRFLRERGQVLKFSLDTQCYLVLTQMIMAFNNDEKALFSPTAANPFYPEIEHWFREGSTSDETEKTNPTLIRPFTHKWKLHYSSCAFESYLPFERQDLKRCKTLTATCKENLSLMVKRFQQQKNECLETLKVTLWTGDGLSLCTSGLPPDLLFDVIDTSNVSDHIGLLNVLVCCAPKLKEPNTSLLLTSSMLWGDGCKNIEEYYNKCVGVPVQLLPTVLGLKLGVDLDLGSNKLPDRFDASTEILCWVKADDRRTMVTIDRTSDVLQALLRLAERCFNLLQQRFSRLLGATLSSPLTFLRIIHQIGPILKGGATQIFDLLESELPADFQTKFGLSWNLLKASIGNEREPIVEIRASVNISIPSWYKGTPVPMICIMKQSDYVKERLLRMFGSPESVKPTFSAIYNSLRYDVDDRTLTFHLREKDWSELKSNSWMWISSNDLGIIREDVRFGDEIVESISRVDPVEQFGLLSVQTFTVTESDPFNMYFSCSVDGKSSKFQISRMRGKILCDIPKKGDGTVGELVLQNPAQVPFHALAVWDAKLHDISDPFNMYFSCPVDGKSSKFQISRMRGKILCDIPKKEDGTVGELVLQNPAPVPFHALAVWDAELHDIRICGRMFRTKLDLELKKQIKSGSPFFNLRDSILSILKLCIDKPKELIIHYIDERGIVEEPYLAAESFTRKKGFVIVVQQLYKWKYLPVAKVLFCDCQRFADMFRNKSESTRMKLMESFWSVAWPRDVHGITADQQVSAKFLVFLSEKKGDWVMFADELS
ncbi:uncharacterized protein LOC110064535 [Orbicella faveolata]|uniref:uncharacterized protein LOC110064535 n=1 Tax=Orbicella faveolata TaxID=48498 RepID=UPI0009E5DA78|nr:uncharacterized protein LOC110064535 [Orbicella faveolata]